MQTIGKLVDEWNESIQENIMKVNQWNDSLIARYNNQEITAEAVLAGWEVKPAVLSRPSISWCRHWKQRFGWTMITRGQDDSQWLAWDHPDMIASRASFQKLLADEQINTGLVLNYDQMWRTCWQTTRYKLAYKSRRYAGQMGGKQRMGPRDDKKITSVKGARRSLTVL
eukprot:Skav221333  [mRNA]  locus=scaffold1234:42453:42959:+ [translate_table: standard]